MCQDAPIGFVMALFDIVAFLIQLAILAWATRRLLGIPFSLTRLVLAGLLAIVVINPIARALVGHPATLQPYLAWEGALALAAALLCAIVFLALAEVFVPNGSVPGPVAMLRALPGAWSRYRRYVQVSWIVARHGLGGYLRGTRPAFEGGPPPSRLARALRDTLDEAGVAFVKLGQLLATRRDLLPAEFADELATLQDQAKPIPWPQVRRVLEGELGPRLSELAEIDQTPLAAASVAQVHAARLRTGERVVLKVRRPGIEVLVGRDLRILDRWAGRAEQRTEWGRAIRAQGLARGFAESLRSELDFRRELRNLIAVQAALDSHRSPGGVVAPRPHAELSTERLLVMERLDGTPLDRVQAPEEERLDLARRLLTTLLEQILVDGVFHADPHSGNLLVLDDGRLGMLDLGSVGRLDRSLRESLGRLLLAVDAEDTAGMTDAVLEIADAPAELDERGLRRALGTFLARHVGAGRGGGGGELFWDLARLATRYGLAILGDVAAALRALGTLEGVLTGWVAGFDFVAEARRFGGGALLLPSAEAIEQDLRREMMRALPALRALPRRLDRLSADLEEGRLTVRVRLTASAADRGRAAGVLNLGALTALSATAGVMAVLLLLVSGGPQVTPSISLYHYFAYCLLIICAVLALRVLVAVFRRDQAGPAER